MRYNDVQVDREGKFCYGKLTLKMITLFGPGIPPSQFAGVRLHIDLSTAFRR